ncbi:hypothetical protein MY3296_007475 [Beauveria thailandica]
MHQAAQTGNLTLAADVSRKRPPTPCSRGLLILSLSQRQPDKSIPDSQGHVYSASTLPGQVPMVFGVVGHAPGQGPAGAEAIPAMVAPWQQQSSREYAGLEDPLFGFNRSALDDFSFLGW